MRRIILFCLLALALGACVSNRAAREDAFEQDGSRPGSGSIYYYTAASLLRAQGDFTTADALFRKAQTNDPGSLQIRRAILRNAIDQYRSGQADSSAVYALLAEQAGTPRYTEDLLYSLMDFYSQADDAAGVESAVRELQDRFPSARAHIQRFIYELKYQNKPQVRHLDSALELAQNDPESLLMLSQVYMFYDRAKQKQALLRYHEIAPSSDSHDQLVGFIAGSQDLELARSYLAGLAYPEDRAWLLNLSDGLLSLNQPALLAELAPSLLDTGDLEIVNSLALAALLQRRGDILASVDSLQAAHRSPEADKQPLRALLAANSIESGDGRPLAPWVDPLRESKYFDDVLTYYNFALARDLSGDWTSPGAAALAHFSEQVRLRLPDGPPARYLQDLSRAAGDSTFTGWLDSRFELLLWLKGRTVLSARDYEQLLQYYFLRGRSAERRSLLDEALLHYPDQPMFCNDLGYSLLLEQGATDRAGELIRSALASEPDNPFYLDSLAWYHYLKGEYRQALELTALPQAMDDPPAEIAWHIGAIYLKLGDFPQARLWLEKCLASGDDPENTARAEQALKSLP